jgi:hypothetical protein
MKTPIIFRYIDSNPIMFDFECRPLNMNYNKIYVQNNLSAIWSIYRRRLAHLAQSVFPWTLNVPKCCIFDGLSYETFLEKIDGGPKYISHFFVFS